MSGLETDILVIGGGIAGASVAAHLAEARNVVLVEREERPGYHSTGRSAALFTEIYGNATIRSLTRASRGFLFETPAGFAESPLVRPRGCLYIATAAQQAALQAFHRLEDIAPATRMLDLDAAHALCPILRRDYLAQALLEPDCADIDVQALHQGYLRLLKRREGRLLTRAPVLDVERRGERWLVQAGESRVTAALIVNAAGAWADEVATLAGGPRVGLAACRRTALLVSAPAGLEIGAWPFVNDIEERFYFKPDAGSIFLSPADETPVPPGDVQPDDLDVATAIDRVERATTLAIGRPRAMWAGLRTFAPDRTPVVGHSSVLPGFFWLAGQGGYGIQTAPALSRAAAALALGRPIPADVLDQGLDPRTLAPARFAA